MISSSYDLRTKIDNIAEQMNYNKSLINDIFSEPAKVLQDYNMVQEPEMFEKLYAWVPIPTIGCISEAGTTSDRCSTAVSLCSCIPPPPPMR